LDPRKKEPTLELEDTDPTAKKRRDAHVLTEAFIGDIREKIINKFKLYYKNGGFLLRRRSTGFPGKKQQWVHHLLENTANETHTSIFAWSKKQSEDT
jgi:hypothetical protein